MTPGGAALLEVVLTDEELAVLVPCADPLPHVDRLTEADSGAALLAAARSLLVRGLAVHDGEDVVAAPVLAPLVEPLRSDGWRLQVASPHPEADTSLTVVRPAGEGVHTHDTSEDGVHVLGLLSRTDALAALRRVLDPMRVADLTGGSASVPGAAPPPVPGPDQLRGAVRLRLWQGEHARDVLVVTAEDGCWRVEGPTGVPVPLDGPGLEALVDDLLPVAGPAGATAG